MARECARGGMAYGGSGRAMRGFLGRNVALESQIRTRSPLFLVAPSLRFWGDVENARSRPSDFGWPEPEFFVANSPGDASAARRDGGRSARLGGDAVVLADRL